MTQEEKYLTIDTIKLNSVKRQVVFSILSKDI